MRGSISLLLVLLSLLSSGCGSEPIPLSAQAGSTIAIPLVGEETFGETVGYAGPYAPEDPQRGEISVLLVDSADPQVEIPLSTRYVTRVHADPASEAVIDGRPGQGGLGQILALVDIPPEVAPGTYGLAFARRRPSSAGGWEDADAPPRTGASLTVLPHEIDGIPLFAGPEHGEARSLGAPTPAIGYFGTGGFDLSNLLSSYVPNPKVVIAIEPSSEPSFAARLEIEFPPEKVEILSVFEEQHAGHGSMLRWSLSEPRGRVRVDLVDPDGSVVEIAIAFRLLDFASTGRAVIDDFRVMSSIFYRADGSISERHGAVVRTIR